MVYGMSEEGYAAACIMAVKGTPVSLVDESTASAVQLTAEMAKIYPDVHSLKEDEPILFLEPTNKAVGEAAYLVFSPRMKAGEDAAEVLSKFKDAASCLGRDSSVVYCLPTGLGGNAENMSVLEHVTGFEVGKTISYYYYPLGGPSGSPAVIGTAGAGNENLARMLAAGRRVKAFASIPTSEYLYTMHLLSHFTSVYDVLEVCRIASGGARSSVPVPASELSLDGITDLFLDDMVVGQHDMCMLPSSPAEGLGGIAHLVNMASRGIDQYIRRLATTLHRALKRHEIRPSKTQVLVSWTINRHEIRADKVVTLGALIECLRDYVSDVAYERDAEQFHTDRTLVVVACSKADYERAAARKDSPAILLKANPMCEVSVGSGPKRNRA